MLTNLINQFYEIQMLKLKWNAGIKYVINTEVSKLSMPGPNPGFRGSGPFTF